MAARKSALLIDAPPTQADNTEEIAANGGLSLVDARAEHVDPIALAMDQALGLDATRPFTTMSRWNSHAIEFAWSLAPVVCDLFSLAVKACVEVQLSWLSWIPGWNLGTGGDGSAPVYSEEQRRHLAESMDVAIGAQPAQEAPALSAYAAAATASIPVAAADPAAEEAELPEKALAAAS